MANVTNYGDEEVELKLTRRQLEYLRILGGNGGLGGGVGNLLDILIKKSVLTPGCSASAAGNHIKTTLDFLAIKQYVEDRFPNKPTLKEWLIKHGFREASSNYRFVIKSANAVDDIEVYVSGSSINRAFFRGYQISKAIESEEDVKSLVVAASIL